MLQRKLITLYIIPLPRRLPHRGYNDYAIFFLHGTLTASIECANTMLYDLGYGKLILLLVVFLKLG